jgi:predicted RNA binding protein YcfA (HicA-like mRNA interferase family)
LPESFYSDVTAVLRSLGFKRVDGGKGSHEKWKRPEGPTLIVPFNLKSRHTANGILKDAGSDQKL